MLVKPQSPQAAADVSDLKNSPVVTWQHKWYFAIALISGVILPGFIPGYFWGDWRGGLYFAAFLRLTVVHHVGYISFYSVVSHTDLS